MPEFTFFQKRKAWWCIFAFFLKSVQVFNQNSLLYARNPTFWPSKTIHSSRYRKSQVKQIKLSKNIGKFMRTKLQGFKYMRVDLKGV